MFSFSSAQDLERLKGIYAEHTDIDLIMGAIAERPKPGATIGVTFACIIGNFEIFNYDKSNNKPNRKIIFK